MGWIEPKTDWLPTQQGVGDGDFNRIEGNIQFLSESGVISDYEGNAYRTITINGQSWTKDNWSCTTYSDGTAIPELTDQTEWGTTALPAYCKYNNGVTKYGLYYNWYTVEASNPKSIAPDGWRVPTLADWTALETYLIANGYNEDNSLTGNRIASALASRYAWNGSGTGGAPGYFPGNTNHAQISIFPGGRRSLTEFSLIGDSGYIWLSDEDSSNPLKGHAVELDGNSVSSDGLYTNSKGNGYNVKLVRDI